MLKLIAVLTVCGIATYYFLDNTVSEDLNKSYCRREAQEEVDRVNLEAITVRDRVSEEDFFWNCYDELEGSSILEVLVKSNGSETGRYMEIGEEE